MSRMNDAMGEANQGASQIKDAASQVGQSVREVGSQVRDAATEQYNQMRDRANDYYEQGRQKAQEWEQGLESYVHEKPMQALLVAAGVGLLLGIIWKRS